MRLTFALSLCVACAACLAVCTPKVTDNLSGNTGVDASKTNQTSTLTGNTIGPGASVWNWSVQLGDIVPWIVTVGMTGGGWTIAARRSRKQQQELALLTSLLETYRPTHEQRAAGRDNEANQVVKRIQEMKLQNPKVTRYIDKAVRKVAP